MSKGSLVRRVMHLYGKDAALRLAQRFSSLDGGPGSGNFGHKGRPGKVGGSGESGGPGSSKEEYHARVEKMRSEILSKKQNEQAKFADRVGIAGRQTCVAAMKNGTASDLVNRYFDIMEENGDPEPTKDLRKSPNINDEVREGKHKVPEDQLWPNDPYTQARIDYIKEWTGMDDDEARETLGEFQTWFGGSWDHADTDKIDRYIDQDGAFDGPIYRGLEFLPAEYDEFMKNAQQGGTIKMIGMNSSWSTDEETARGFAGSSDRCKHVLIKCVKNKTSAPVSHLSTQGEDEVIAHSRAQWTVLSVNEGDRRTEIIVVESEYRMSEDERDRRREQYDSIPEDGYEPLKDRIKAQQAFFRADPPSADLRKKLNSEDGGPGSGNFGHKGRPGQRGGSGGGSAGRVRTKNTSETVALVAGKENYMAKPEFQDAYRKWNDAHRKSQELTKEWLDLRRQLDNEIVETPEVKELGRKYADLFDAYTEKGKEIKKRSEEVREEQKAAEEDDKKYGDILERMTADNRRREKEDFRPKPLTPAKQKDYDGFKLESDVPYVREKLEDGSAWIAEMDPKEYLERCAFQIFNRSSLESTVWAVDTTNVNRYADQMEKGDRFALPYLNFSSGNQEGRHRAVAAMMNGYSKIPVVIVGKRPEAMAEDGGPGSGNWGHKGRPGKRGGSGPGGGSQYRGGRSDIGYYGSRGDWLNGLSGDKQHQAAKFIGTKRLELKDKLNRKEKIEGLWKQGYLTRDEADEALKKAGIKDIREDMSPEEYVMKNGSEMDKADLIGHVKEARNWDQNAEKMIKANLSEDERKIYDYVKNNFPDKDNKDHFQVLLDLEAKAMDLPTSGADIPLEIEYAAGTKERPAPEAKIPKNLDENNDWLEGLPQEKQDYILGISRGLGVDPQAFGGDIVMNYAENRMMSRVWNGEEKAFWEYRRYLDAKDALIGANFFKQCEAAADMNSTSNIGNLGDKPSIILSEFLNQLADEQKEQNPTTSIGSHGDILESGFMQDKSVPASAKAAYLQLKSIALGQQTNAVRPDDVAKELHKYMIQRRQIRQEEKEYGPKRERFKQDRAAREKSYQDATSSKQIGEEMRKSGMFKSGSNVSLSKTDLKSAQEAAMSYEKVMDRYPFLIGQLYGMDENETGAINTYASCSMRAGGTVHLNASDRFYGNFNKLIESYQSDVNSGYHPAGTNGTAIVTHELGHALDGFLSNKGVNGARLFSTDANAFSGILRRSVLKSLRMTKSVVERELSRYATKNAYEWFAECFAEGMTSENPRPMAKECMRQLDEILKKEGLINA